MEDVADDEDVVEDAGEDQGPGVEPHFSSLFETARERQERLASSQAALSDGAKRMVEAAMSAAAAASAGAAKSTDELAALAQSARSMQAAVEEAREEVITVTDRLNGAQDALEAAHENTARLERERDELTQELAETKHNLVYANTVLADTQQERAAAVQARAAAEEQSAALRQAIDTMSVEMNALRSERAAAAAAEEERQRVAASHMDRAERPRDDDEEEMEDVASAEDDKRTAETCCATIGIQTIGTAPGQEAASQTDVVMDGARGGEDRLPHSSAAGAAAPPTAAAARDVHLDRVADLPSRPGEGAGPLESPPLPVADRGGGGQPTGAAAAADDVDERRSGSTADAMATSAEASVEAGAEVTDLRPSPALGTEGGGEVAPEPAPSPRPRAAADAGVQTDNGPLEPTEAPGAALGALDVVQGVSATLSRPPSAHQRGEHLPEPSTEPSSLADVAAILTTRVPGVPQLATLRGVVTELRRLDERVGACLGRLERLRAAAGGGEAAPPRRHSGLAPGSDHEPTSGIHEGGGAGEASAMRARDDRVALDSSAVSTANVEGNAANMATGVNGASEGGAPRHGARPSTDAFAHPSALARAESRRQSWPGAATGAAAPPGTEGGEGDSSTATMLTHLGPAMDGLAEAIVDFAASSRLPASYSAAAAAAGERGASPPGRIPRRPQGRPLGSGRRLCAVRLAQDPLPRQAVFRRAGGQPPLPRAPSTWRRPSRQSGKRHASA